MSRLQQVLRRPGTAFAGIKFSGDKKQGGDDLGN